MPCHSAAPIRSGRFAPWYWATKVVTYSPTAVKSPITAQVMNIPVAAPATASGEYQVRNTRSTKVGIVNDMWLRISGYETRSTSRTPPSPASAARSRELTGSGRLGEIEPVERDAAVADHEQRVVQRAHVLERVGLDRDQVRLEALLERADALLALQHLGGDDGRAAQRLQRRHPQLDEVRDLLGDPRHAR